MNLPKEISEWAYTEKEMADILNISVVTLKRRRYTGSNHPPCKPYVKGHVIYPKSEFSEWAMKKPIIYEVRSNAS